MVKIAHSKYQIFFKTLIRKFQDMYCHAHKTATLTPIQHAVVGGGGQKLPILRRHSLLAAPFYQFCVGNLSDCVVFDDQQ